MRTPCPPWPLSGESKRFLDSPLIRGRGQTACRTPRREPPAPLGHQLSLGTAKPKGNPSQGRGGQGSSPRCLGGRGSGLVDGAGVGAGVQEERTHHRWSCVSCPGRTGNEERETLKSTPRKSDSHVPGRRGDRTSPTHGRHLAKGRGALRRECGGHRCLAEAGERGGRGSVLRKAVLPCLASRSCGGHGP